MHETVDGDVIYHSVKTSSELCSNCRSWSNVIKPFLDFVPQMLCRIQMQTEGILWQYTDLIASKGSVVNLAVWTHALRLISVTGKMWHYVEIQHVSVAFTPLPRHGPMFRNTMDPSI
jgi:hypothetical protein